MNNNRTVLSLPLPSFGKLERHARRKETAPDNGSSRKTLCYSICFLLVILCPRQGKDVASSAYKVRDVCRCLGRSEFAGAKGRRRFSLRDFSFTLRRRLSWKNDSGGGPRERLQLAVRPRFAEYGGDMPHSPSQQNSRSGVQARVHYPLDSSVVG
jgi:hypothetical protein